jgi:hypothetical protein
MVVEAMFFVIPENAQTVAVAIQMGEQSIGVALEQNRMHLLTLRALCWPAEVYQYPSRPHLHSDERRGHDG